MSRKMSDKTKKIKKIGSGTGKNYVPYISTSEFNSLGTTSVIKDWKTGRGVHCLSQGEAYWYYILRWDDNNIDIREQFPLDNALTNKIADSYGFKHPGSRDHIMTIDFMATESDDTLHAYSIKPSKDDLDQRTLEKLCIEKAYCLAKDIKYTLLFKDEANIVLANNIRLITEFYDLNNVFDTISAIKFKLAHKYLYIDLTTRPLTNDILHQLQMEE